MYYVASMLYDGASGFLPLLPMMALFHSVMLKKDRMNRIKTAIPHMAATYLFCFVVMFCLSVTGIPSLSHLAVDMAVNWVPFADLRGNWHQYLLNIVLFMPIGFMLPMLWKKFEKKRATFFCGFLFSLSIELIQLFSHRITDIDDLLMNTLGTAIGYFLFARVKKTFPNVSVLAIEHTNHWKWELYACFCLTWLSMFLIQPFTARVLFGPPRFI